MNRYEQEYYRDIKLGLTQLKRIADLLEKIANEKEIKNKN